jgi:two-component system, NarL family, invasion response regulator UvrY
MEVPPVRVVLADDHPLLIAGFSMALKGFGIEVIGNAKTPEEAINQYRTLKPEVLVLDIRFSGQSNGLSAARTIRNSTPDAKIVFLSQFDADNLVTEAYRIGGCAFITKDADPADLAAAIKKARDGETYFLPRIAERLAKLTIEGDRSPQTILDERELEIFRCLARGLTHAEISQRVNLSLKTIGVHVQQIKDKLRATRPADLTLLAVKYGLLQPDDPQ